MFLFKNLYENLTRDMNASCNRCHFPMADWDFRLGSKLQIVWFHGVIIARGAPEPMMEYALHFAGCVRHCARIPVFLHFRSNVAGAIVLLQKQAAGNAEDVDTWSHL
jgi:hypothetical protein